jgi:EamA domain-containing membrane protein RarD
MQLPIETPFPLTLFIISSSYTEKKVFAMLDYFKTRLFLIYEIFTSEFQRDANIWLD